MSWTEWSSKTKMKNQVFLLFSVQSSFNLICQRIVRSNNSHLNLQIIKFKHGNLSLLWRRFVHLELGKHCSETEAVKNVKFDSKLEISKVEEFIVHMPFVSLAYPFSAYQIESGYLSPFQWPFLKGEGLQKCIFWRTYN